MIYGTNPGEKVQTIKLGKAYQNKMCIDDKHILETNFMKNPSKKNCRFCEFNQTEHCDVGVK